MVSVTWTLSVQTEHTAFSYSADIAQISDQTEILHEWKAYYFQMETELSPLAGPFPSSMGPDVLSLCFLGSSALRNGMKAQNTVDWKGRPLLAVLLANRGISY